jgi:outer membrane protein TolC
MEVFTETISTLVENELRPGADLSLARAELARARSELIRAEELRERSRVSLAEWLGRAGERVEVDAAELLKSSPASEGAPPEEEGAHPLADLGKAERDAARARRDVAAGAYRPKVDVLGALYGRGTGAALDGSFEGGSAGLWPERTNWAVGLAVRFPLLDFATRQETKVQDYLEEAAEARYERAVERVASELGRARIHLDSARRITENTPAELEAALALQVQARARYDSGLAAVLEVAEAERILRRAETEDAVARLDLWRARFEVAAAEGDLNPVLSELQ